MKLSKKTKLLIKDSFLCTVFSFILIFILSFLVINISFFNPLKKVVKDFSFLDVYYAENFNTSNEINADIILLNIEHRDRFEISQMIDKVLLSDPKVVGVDIIFKDQKEAFIDSILGESLNNQKIVSSYILEKDKIIKNHPQFLNENTSGFVNLNFDNKESVIRNFVGSKEFKSDTHLSFSAQIVKKIMEPSEWDNYSYDKVLKGNTLISYHGNRNSFLTFSYDEFMESDNKNLLKNKIVILGYIGTPTGNEYDVEDKHFTPLNKITAGKSIPDMFGVVVHANIITMLMKHDLMYRVSNFWIGIISFFSTFFMLMYLMKLEKKGKITYRTIKKIILFTFTILVTGISLWLFKMGVIIKIVPIIGVTLLSISYLMYYKDLIDFIKRKREWKSYIRD